MFLEKCQMGLMIRLWNKSKNEAVVHYCGYKFLGQTSTLVLYHQCEKGLKDLKIDKMF